MDESRILYSKENKLGIITLNRPERMNAITDDMLVDLQNIVNEAAADNEVRALIITGNGRAFCGGTDVTVGINRVHSTAGAERAAKIKNIDLPPTTLPYWTFTRIPKPTIAAVNGAAVGMGAEWTVQCDFRIASENARFGWVFSLRGICPDTGAGQTLLPYIVGMPKALEMMYSGAIIDAKEAERIGLVSKVVPHDQLMSAAKEFATIVTRGAPLAMKAIKEITYGALEWPVSTVLKENGARFQSTSLTEDSKEGVQSFLEKREPRWKGR